MNPGLFIFVIKSAMRLGRTGGAALAQHARDYKALFPEAVKVEMTRENFVRAFFKMDQEYLKLVEGDEAPYAAWWSADFHDVTADEEAIETLYVVAMKIIAEKRGNRAMIDQESLVGAVMVNQWAEGKGPVSAWVKVALAVADIALEYVGTDSSRLDIDGNGGKLLRAFALEVSNLLPDDDALGEKGDFFERLGGLFMQAGLRTLHENSEIMISETHLQKLITNLLKPVIDELPSSRTALSEHVNYKKAAEALMGPAANAALVMVGKNRQVFFGRRFDPNRAIGALTKALIEQGAKTGIDKVFTEEGLIVLYQAALGVASERPELFLGRADTDPEKAAGMIFSAAANTLKKNPPPFDGQLGIELVVTALDTLKTNAPAMIDFDPNWEPVVEKLVDQVVTGLKEGFEIPDGDPIESVLTAVELGEMAKVFVSRAAGNPAMISGDSQRLKRLVRGIAEGIRQDEANLFTAEDWLEIAADAALKTIADDQEYFLGADFRPDRAGGAVMQAFLKTTAKRKFKDAVSKKSLVALYQAALRIAADQPELFIGRDATTADAKKAAALAVGQELFSSVAKTLKNNPPPFSGDFGTELIVTTLDSINKHMPALIRFDRNWDLLLETIVGQIISGLMEGFQETGGDPPRSILTSKQLLELARVFVEQAAKNPNWIAGRNQDLQRVVKAVAESMAADRHLLLGSDDWLEIAHVAAAEAAANPGRLFGLDRNSQGRTLAVDLLKVLFTVASEIFAHQDLQEFSVLYGLTLREGINILVRAASGDPHNTHKNLALIKEYAALISMFVAENGAQFGNQEWLKLFRKLLPHALPVMHSKRP